MVFTGLVNDAYLTMTCGRWVRKELVEFPDLKGGGVTIILHAHRNAPNGSGRGLLQLDLEFNAADAGRLVPVNLCQEYRPVLKLYTRPTFSFAPPPRPVDPAQPGELAN